MVLYEIVNGKRTAISENVAWVVSNQEIATIDKNGTLTGIAMSAEKVTVTASYNNNTVASCYIQVIGNVSIVLVESNTRIGNHNAVLYANIINPDKDNISKCGMILYDSEQKEIGSVSEECPAKYRYIKKLPVFYRLLKDMDVTLEPETEYYYKFWAIVGGIQYYMSNGFTTAKNYTTVDPGLPMDNCSIQSDYGQREQILGIKVDTTNHTGIDLGGNTKIKAIGDGIVVQCGEDIYAGNAVYVVIQHADGYVSIYYHLKSYSVHKGENVQKGDPIGVMGSTGFSTGPHLHLEIRSVWGGGNNLYKSYYDPVSKKNITWSQALVDPKVYIPDLVTCYHYN